MELPAVGPAHREALAALADAIGDAVLEGRSQGRSWVTARDELGPARRILAVPDRLFSGRRSEIALPNLAEWSKLWLMGPLQGDSTPWSPSFLLSVDPASYSMMKLPDCWKMRLTPSAANCMTKDSRRSFTSLL